MNGPLLSSERVRIRTEGYDAWLTAARVNPSPSPAAVSITEPRSQPRAAAPRPR